MLTKPKKEVSNETENMLLVEKWLVASLVCHLIIHCHQYKALCLGHPVEYHICFQVKISIGVNFRRDKVLKLISAFFACVSERCRAGVGNIPKGAHEKLGLLSRAAPRSWTQFGSILNLFLFKLYKLQLPRVDVTIKP